MATDDQHVPPEERERIKRAATMRRIKILGTLCVCLIIIRVVVKPPPPPKAAVHRNPKYRALPGMLDNLSEANRAKLSPVMLAKLQKADKEGGEAKPKAEVVLVQKYEPLKAPVNLGSDEETYPTAFTYAAKRKPMKEKDTEPEQDSRRTMLVRFTSGGVIKAEDAQRMGSKVSIRLDSSAQANMPGHWVGSISSNALTWKEPIPTGHARLKPAPGITITLAKNLAKRISIQGKIS